MDHTERERPLLRKEKEPRERAREARLSPVSAQTPLAERVLFDPYGIVADFDRQFESLRRNMESMLLPTWSSLATRPLLGAPDTRLARADYSDRGESFAVDLEMPGFDRDEIEIELTPTELRVAAKREREDKQERAGERYLAHERAYASLRRSLTFPEEVLPDAATAKLENGVLKLTLPKKAPLPAPKSVKLKVE